MMLWMSKVIVSVLGRGLPGRFEPVIYVVKRPGRLCLLVH